MRGLASPHTFMGATSGGLVRCLRAASEVQFWCFWFRIVRSSWFDSGPSVVGAFGCYVTHFRVRVDLES